MLVMALIVFRAFGGFADSKEGLTDLVYDYLNLNIDAAAAVEDGPPEAPAIPETDSTTDAQAETRSWINQQIDLVFGDEDELLGGPCCVLDGVAGSLNVGHDQL